MPSLRVLVAAACALWMGACQRYPFEQREVRRSQVQKITEVVATTRPTDILFVVDNSATMQEERALISQNVGAFLDRLVETSMDFQVGVVTTDVDCNLPGNDCSAPDWATSGKSNPSCCAARGDAPVCRDRDTDNDGKVDTSDCDGGRLRSADGRHRVFGRPAAADRAKWVSDLQDVIATLDCNQTSTPKIPEGSPFEAGLEAAVRAVSCSAGLGAPQCPEPAVAQLDAGFVRPDADLVLVFITDEDDCSFRDPTAYEHVFAADTVTQQTHLCSPEECYAGYDPLWNWSKPYFQCAGVARTEQPPVPDAVGDFIDALVAAKGGDVRRVRAAAIVGGVPDAVEGGLRAAACFTSGGGPSATCGCLSTTGNDFFCSLTGSLGQATTHLPAAASDFTTMCQALSPNFGGCTGLPGTRYTSFLDQLAARRVAAGGSPDVLADSICQAFYDDTLQNIVNDVIVKNCWELGLVPRDADDIEVTLNGVPLPSVPKAGNLEGWSWVEGTAEICLEGGLKKTVDDRFEVYVLDSSE